MDHRHEKLLNSVLISVNAAFEITAFGCYKTGCDPHLCDELRIKI